MGALMSSIFAAKAVSRPVYSSVDFAARTARQSVDLTIPNARMEGLDGPMACPTPPEVDAHLLCVASWRERRLADGAFNDYLTTQYLPDWVPDREASACTICKASFSFHYRRHHCRRCGQIVCHKCSKRQLLLPHLSYGHKPQRVCDSCYHFRMEQLEFLKRGMMLNAIHVSGESVTKEEVRMWLSVDEEKDSVWLQWVTIYSSSARAIPIRIPLLSIENIVTAGDKPAKRYALFGRHVGKDRMFTVYRRTAETLLEYHFELPTRFKFTEWTEALKECLGQCRTKDERIRTRTAASLRASMMLPDGTINFEEHPDDDTLCTTSREINEQQAVDTKTSEEEYVRSLLQDPHDGGDVIGPPMMH